MRQRAGARFRGAPVHVTPAEEDLRGDFLGLTWYMLVVL